MATTTRDYKTCDAYTYSEVSCTCTIPRHASAAQIQTSIFHCFFPCRNEAKHSRCFTTSKPKVVYSLLPLSRPFYPVTNLSKAKPHHVPIYAAFAPLSPLLVVFLAIVHGCNSGVFSECGTQLRRAHRTARARFADGTQPTIPRVPVHHFLMYRFHRSTLNTHLGGGLGRGGHASGEGGGRVGVWGTGWMLFQRENETRCRNAEHVFSSLVCCCTRWRCATPLVCMWFAVCVFVLESRSG